MDAKNIKSTLTGLPAWCAWAMMTACLGMSPARAAVSYLNLAQSPATSAAQNIAPNLIYLLDDSGSMQFEYIGTTGNIGTYDYGYPLGNSQPYNSNTYSTSLPKFPRLPFTNTNNVNAAQYRSASDQPGLLQSGDHLHALGMRRAPIRKAPQARVIPFRLPPTPAGITCHWDSNVNLWLMSDANPNKAYLNPANQGAGWRSLNVWNDGSGSNNNTANNGYVDSITTRFGSSSYDKVGFWPAVYANYQGGSNSSISSYQFVQICPPSTAPTTNSNSVASNDTVNGYSRCTPPPTLPASHDTQHTYLDASGNYVYVDGSGNTNGANLCAGNAELRQLVSVLSFAQPDGSGGFIAGIHETAH